MKVLIVQDRPPASSETFLQAQAAAIDAEVFVAFGVIPTVDGSNTLAPSFGLGWQVLRNGFGGLRPSIGLEKWAVTQAFLRLFRKVKPDVVLGQFGNIANRVALACQLGRVPLVAHFHGQDAFRKDTLQQNENYEQLWPACSQVIVVSREMQNQVIQLGADAEKVHLNPYGIDCSGFRGAEPAKSEKLLVAVGRFVEKKAPHKTIFAFSRLLEEFPDARLRMIGDGPLRPVCMDLVEQLGIQQYVEFPGSLDAAAIQLEMRRARAFVQHSVVASDGDREGLPLAILEAAATGLPVVATVHAGIPEAIEHGKSGFLVEEHDVNRMSEYIGILLGDAARAQKLGEYAREQVLSHFTIQKNAAGIQRVLELAVAAGSNG